MSVAEILARAARDRPERVVLCSGPRRVAAAELDAEARAFAGGLSARGLGRGDRVALCADGSPRFVAAWFGAAYAGCAVVPLPAPSTAPEIALRVQHARCRLLLVDPARADVARRAAGAGVPVALLDDVRGDPRAPAAVDADDVAMILYTSGTVGAAKGACIGHGSLVDHTDAMVAVLGLGASDVVLAALPPSHSYGIRMGVLAPLRAGARAVVVDRFDARRTLATCSREGVTWLPAVPTMLAAWAGCPPEPRLSSVRWCLCAGAPLADDVRRRAEARLGAEVRQGYGLTEATFSTVNAPPDARVPGSVGRPAPGVEVRVAGEDGAALGPGRAGEVQVRGRNVMLGYLDDPAATAASRHGTWQRTGDIGVLDAHGRLAIVDRSKDVILRGGHSVYPAEVEDALADHPAVAQVAVVGRDDAFYGEEIVAVVVCAGAPPSPAELDAFARRRLSPVKVPRQIAFVDRLPLGPSGKVLKRELRARIRAGELEPTPIDRGGS